MKAILISIKPRFVAKILNGEKTIEIRKTMPKCDLPIDVYIYCTKCDIKGARENFTFKQLKLLGKVVAKFTLNKVDRYVNGCNVAKKYPTFNDFEKILTPACIYTDELENYCEDLSFYAWHISNLVIFDKPKELSEFRPFNNGMPQYRFTKNGCEYRTLTKAPQSYMFVETGE